MIAPYTDLLPWVVFAVVVRRQGLGFLLGAAAAAATAAVLVALARRRGRPSPFARLGLVWFVLLVAAAFVAHHAPIPDGSARAASALVVAVVAFASLWRTSLAAIYLADQVPPAFRRTAGFDGLHRHVTRAWGVAALVLAAAFAALGVDSGPTAVTVLGWVVPVLVIGATMAWTSDKTLSLIVAATLESAPALDPEIEDVAWDLDRSSRRRHSAATDPPPLHLVPRRGSRPGGA